MADRNDPPPPARVATTVSTTTVDGQTHVHVHLHVHQDASFGSADRQMLIDIRAQQQAQTGQETTEMNSVSQIVQQLKDTNTKLAAEGARVETLEQNILTLENGLSAGNAAQQQQVTALQQTNADQKTQLDALNAKLADLQANGVDTTDLQAIADALAANVAAVTATHDKMQADLVANSAPAATV